MPTLALLLVVWEGEVSLAVGGLCWLARQRLRQSREGCE
jgi:hypothetical protein